MRLTRPRNTTRDEILKVSGFLFAQRGYDGVAMREIAAAVGVQAAALYYYFPDKHSLYFAVMERVIKDCMKGPTDALISAKPPMERLQNFLVKLVEIINDEPDILILLQRERIDADEARKRLLMDHFLAPHFRNVTALMAELDPEADPILLTSSIMGMVLHHLEWRSIAHLYPEWKPEYDDPNLFGLLRTLFGAKHESDAR